MTYRNDTYPTFYGKKTTTMDPVERRMQQVNINDVQDANHSFEMLMGDDVEPRREFIDENALTVTDLDI